MAARGTAAQQNPLDLDGRLQGHCNGCTLLPDVYSNALVLQAL